MCKTIAIIYQVAMFPEFSLISHKIEGGKIFATQVIDRTGGDIVKVPRHGTNICGFDPVVQ